jgi:polysaccharide export outer membrane protein
LGEVIPKNTAEPPTGVITPISPGLIAAQRAARPNSISPAVRELFGKSGPYKIGPSDVVTVLVYDHPELLPNAGTVIGQQADPTGVSSAPGFIVGADGEITYPFIGRVRLGGLTESEAADLIQARLARYVKNPQVTVRISSFRSRRVYVEGEVRAPGTQIVTDVPMTLLEAINRAGGITANGDRSFVTLTRDSRTTLVDLMSLQDVGGNPNDILLANGDLITVHHRDESKVIVLGEVLRPSALQMRNGRLSLNEAIGEAGGPNLATANTSQIYVIRSTPAGEPTVFHLNAAAPTALALAEMFPLRARDVVYIDPVPLVNWNRIVSLVLPTANALNVGRQVVSP